MEAITGWGRTTSDNCAIVMKFLTPLIINKNNIQIMKGFSFVELLVSMTIGLIILTGVYHYFYSIGQSNQLLKAEARMQENARLAFSVITSVVQQAGSFGCRSKGSVVINSIVNADDQLFHPWQFIEGWEAEGTAYGESYRTTDDRQLRSINSGHWHGTALSIMPKGTKAKEYTDILKVWYVKQQGSITGRSHDVFYFKDAELRSGNLVILNDCRQQVIAQVCECSGQVGDCKSDELYFSLEGKACKAPGNKSSSLATLRVKNIEFGVLEHALFFVSQRSSKYRNKGENQSSLYVRYLGRGVQAGNKQEILAGVENLQVLYGEDTSINGVANYYISADRVRNWDNIVSIKVSLLLRSMRNNLITKKQVLYFNGALVSSATDDHYLRHVYSSTIKLRNRG